MSNYSELCTDSQDLLGTGVGKCPKDLGADVKFFLADESFTGTATELKTKSYWTDAIKAGSVIPFPKVKEVESANVEASYQEHASGDSDKLKDEVRKSTYKFVENIVVHSGLKSYSDSTWYLWFYTEKGYLRCHTIGSDSFQGLKTSNFYVNAQETRTFSEVSKTPVMIEFDDVDDWDMEFGVIQPDFDMKDLEGAYQTSVEVLSSTSTGTELTINAKFYLKGSGDALSGVLPEDIIVYDESGNELTIDSAAESPSGTYAIVCIYSATSGKVGLNGVVQIGTDFYKSVSTAYLAS